VVLTVRHDTKKKHTQHSKQNTAQHTKLQKHIFYGWNETDLTSSKHPALLAKLARIIKEEKQDGRK
jgi:hypothetical protein